MENKSLLYNAMKSDNLRLKSRNMELEKANIALKDQVCSLKFQLRIAKEKIERRNNEISKMIADQCIDLTDITPDQSPKKRKRSIDALIENYLASFESDDEMKEEVVYDDPKPKRRIKF